MTIIDLLAVYQDLLRQYGKDKARQKLWDMGYNRSVTLLIPVFFDENGNYIQLQTEPKYTK